MSAFWHEHAERFIWDFLPTPFLHELYQHWLEKSFPREASVSRHAFARMISAAAAEHSPAEWNYVRSRPSTLMDAREPLAEQLGWSLRDREAALYGLRRAGK